MSDDECTLAALKRRLPGRPSVFPTPGRPGPRGSVRIYSDPPPRKRRYDTGMHGAICRHCRAGRVNRPRGLCWGCYYAPGVKDKYPSESKFARHSARATGTATDELSGEDLDALCAELDRAPVDMPEDRPALDVPVRASGLRVRSVYELTADTAPDVIRARHRAEVAEYRAAHPAADVAEVAAALVLPRWNVERAIAGADVLARKVA